MSGVDKKKLLQKKCTLKFCAIKWCSLKKTFPAKKKNTGERLLGVLVENQGYDTKLYNVHSPVNILSKKKTITSKHAISIDIT